MKLLNQWINFTLHSVDINRKDTILNCKNMRNQRKQNCYNGTLLRPAVHHERTTTTKSKVSILLDWTNGTQGHWLDTPEFFATLCSTKINLSWQTAISCSQTKLIFNVRTILAWLRLSKLLLGPSNQTWAWK